MGFPGGSVIKNLPASVGDTGDVGSTPESGRSPGGRNFNPLQYSCLENPMDGNIPGSCVHGILQARILEWVAYPPSGDLLDPGIKPWDRLLHLLRYR